MSFLICLGNCQGQKIVHNNNKATIYHQTKTCSRFVKTTLQAHRGLAWPLPVWIDARKILFLIRDNFLHLLIKEIYIKWPILSAAWHGCQNTFSWTREKLARMTGLRIIVQSLYMNAGQAINWVLTQTRQGQKQVAQNEELCCFSGLFSQAFYVYTGSHICI